MDTSETFPAALAALARRNGDLEAVVAPEGRVTFAELAARADALAGALAAAGLRPGNRIGSQRAASAVTTLVADHTTAR